MSRQRSERVRPKWSRYVRRFAVLSLAICAASCSIVDSQIDLAYRAQAERQSPLSTIAPLVLRIEVVDQRDVTDPLLIGYKKSGLGNVMASIRSRQDVSGVVRQALESELRNNGHAISADREARFDASLKVRLKKFWTEPIVKIFDVQVLGSLNADIEVSDSLARPIAARTIVGSQIESWQLSIYDAYDRVLNAALSEFVRNFARDPNLLKALRDISPP